MALSEAFKECLPSLKMMSIRNCLQVICICEKLEVSTSSVLNIQLIKVLLNDFFHYSSISFWLFTKILDTSAVAANTQKEGTTVINSSGN